MTELQPNVIVIDDDPGLRDSLASMLRSVGLRPFMFASVTDFLDTTRPDGPTCLVLDVRLPGRSGIDFHNDLVAADIQLPTVFITGHGDIPMSVQAMKRGAIEFLTKPFREQELLDAIHLGLDKDRARLRYERELYELRARFAKLTQREREVMLGVLAGHLNKQIAAELGITETTVKVHRGHVMRKMAATSLPDLTRIADKLKL